MQTHMYMQPYARIQAHLHTYKHTYKYTFTHIQTQTRSHMQKWEGRTGLSRPRTGGASSFSIILELF